MVKSIHVNKSGSFLVAAYAIWKSYVGVSCMLVECLCICWYK